MKTRFRRLMHYIPLISSSTKLGISSTILLFAFFLFVFKMDSHAEQGLVSSGICVVAMAFSFLGDWFLNYFPVHRRPTWMFYCGAITFMLAHLAYATAYSLLIVESNKAFLNPGSILASISIILLISMTVLIAVQNKVSVKPMTILIFSLYTIVIGINFVTIASHSWNFASISFIGAISFLISDYIIGIETIFKVRSRVLRKLVWIFYPLGQILIITCCR